MVPMAKVAGAGSSFAPGALTVAAVNLGLGGASRTDRFGPHHRGSGHRIALAGQPKRLLADCLRREPRFQSCSCRHNPISVGQLALPWRAIPSGSAGPGLHGENLDKRPPI
jgi:hypothetical protein